MFNLFSRSIVLLLLGLLGGMPALGQGTTQQGLPPAQLARAAAAYGDKVIGALREVISYERQLTGQAQSSGSPLGAMRSRNSARQRYDQALVQLIQQQGDPQGVAGALAGAQRQVQSIDQRLVSLNSQSDSPSRDRQLQQTLRDRYNAQTRVNQYIQRWNALINAALIANYRQQRQSLSSNVDGALRELESYDRLIVNAMGTASDGGSAVSSINDRAERLEKQIQTDQRALQQIEHRGATKAAQNNNQDDLRRRIEQNQKDLAGLKRQANTRERQVNQNTNRQTTNNLQNRVNALERLRVALDQLFQFDARLQ